ncbi:MAG: hypothetical protein M1840_008876 [Geoglossum simile]|nr:MAG: hypothetical protein M1840_008876 [Geoglossum simile]
MGRQLAASLIATLRHRLSQHVIANSISSCRTLSPPTVHAIQSYLVKSPYSTKQQLRLTRKDYTVGWVCALSIELAAAQEMLDEEHEGLPQELDDPNIYTLGRIGEHNVVIACLPAGQTGTHSAAVVAVQMKTRFNAIRFGLMVGIGGGVPSTVHDVRLGDVVVSQSYMEHGGVVQYDFGKTTPNGFLRTGFLNAPPTILLNAVASLRAKHL